MSRKLRIGLVGGGLGGLTTALALARHAFDVHVFEQADELKEIGAGLAMTPNAVKVLRALGVEDALRARGFEPAAIVGRDWLTARSLFSVPLGDHAAARFGAALVHIHRADLLDIIATAVGPLAHIHLGRRCTSVASSKNGAVVSLSRGGQEEFDLVVGCDGIRSLVRTALHGSDVPRFTGNMCWRALIDVARLPNGCVPFCATIWVGPGGHVVTFCIRGGTLINVVAVREAPEWIDESWSIKADPQELPAAYPDVHRDLRRLLDCAGSCFKWGLFDRDPLPQWSIGRITLLGDAAHPMLPFLGQGAAMAIEDAFVLARELARSPDDVGAAMRAYEAERVPRTTKVQLAARDQAGIFHGPQGTADLRTDWLYDYDPDAHVGRALGEGLAGRPFALG